MALNLSESRRLAARRNVSQQLPPRLAPLPDSAVGGSLLRQLQQQRRISRNMSPRPERTASGRFASSPVPPGQSPRVSSSSPLQPPFEPLADGNTSSGYHYHFSQSTLGRAQKAKDYLELLAQHRRLLEFIPPLTPDASSRDRAASIGSLPATSATAAQSLPVSHGAVSGSSDLLLPGPVRLGRPYNPLQYIRNRKVRTRERKTVDGQAEGFGDVAKTTEWVDVVAKWAATGQGRLPGGPTLPAFSCADAATAAAQSSPPPASRPSGQGISSKPKRQRIDWVIDPADLIADVYWLEQGDSKKFVEDRHWRRVFPQDPSLYRPAALLTGNGAAASKLSDHSGMAIPIETFGDADPRSARIGPPIRIEALSPDEDHSSARTRARQKLSELKSLHRRNNSSLHNHSSLQHRRGSLSDSSESDDEVNRIRQSRVETSSAGGSEALNQTMLDMVAKENRERDGTGAGARPLEMTPQSAKVVPAISSSSARAYGKQAIQGPFEASSTSYAESQLRSGRASLEVPNSGRRGSTEYDSSRPTSPELRPLSKDGFGFGFVPPLGGDLSTPPSRTTSPPRQRFGKVKGIFGDHSHERDRERERTTSLPIDQGLYEKEELPDLPVTRVSTHQHPADVVQSLSAPITATTTATSDIGDARFISAQDSKGTHSSIRRLGHRSHTDGRKPHGSSSSMANMRHQWHQRSDETTSSGGSGLRSLFKSGGPRIDTMLRSGVSKVGEMLWRREGSDGHFGDSGTPNLSSSSSDDDSEAEAAPRGRLRNNTSALPSRSPSTNVGQGEKRSSGSAKPSERHYLDVMPTFNGRESVTPSQAHLLPPGDLIPRPPSRRSTRFERLKPPRIDVRDASPMSGYKAEPSQRDQSTRPSSLQPVSRQPRRLSHDSDLSESDSRSRRSSHVSGVRSSGASSLAAGTAAAPALPQQPLKFGSTSTASGVTNERLRRSISQPTYHLPQNGGSLSRRELARLRTSVFSSAVLARELARRANEPKVLAPADKGDSNAAGLVVARRSDGSETLTWADVAAHGRNPAQLARRPVKAVELYPLAAQVLGGAIQRSGTSWQASAEAFSGTTVPRLRQRIGTVRTRVAVELTGLARQAADEADEVTRDLVAVQRLQVKRVEDSIEKMLRRRRRRFRWVRRAGWLTVEWLLVGFMWYVWFVVMLARVVLGIGRGVYTGVRWLLWL